MLQNPAFHAFVEAAAGVEKFNYSAMFQKLHVLSQRADKRAVLEEFSLMTGQLRKYCSGSYPELIAYYIYCKTLQQDGEVVDQIDINQLAAALDNGKILQIVNGYFRCRSVVNWLNTTNAVSSTITSLAMPGYFGIMNAMAEASRHPSSSVIALQLIQNHLWLHALLTLPAGVMILINDVKELFDTFFEMHRLMKELENKKLNKALRRQYQEQLMLAALRMKLILTTIVLNLAALIQPLISSAPLFGIGAPYVIILALGIQLFRHLVEASYHLTKWHSLRKRAEKCKDPQQREALLKEADRHFDLMKQNLIKATMTGIAIGLVIGVMIIPSPIQTIVFAALAIIGTIMLLAFAMKRIRSAKKESASSNNKIGHKMLMTPERNGYKNHRVNRLISDDKDLNDNEIESHDYHYNNHAVNSNHFNLKTPSIGGSRYSHPHESDTAMLDTSLHYLPSCSDDSCEQYEDSQGNSLSHGHFSLFESLDGLRKRRKWQMSDGNGDGDGDRRGSNESYRAD